MIRYALKCPSGHVFESWFKSGEAFETLRAGGMVTCPNCGEVTTERALMAPQVRTARSKEKSAVSEVQANMHALAAPDSSAEAALRELRRKVQDNSEYVGNRFAAEARAIHLGDAPERSIYGEASPDDARKLVDDGIPVAPLPFVPSRKTN